MSNPRPVNPLELEQIAAMNPHDLHMFIGNLVEEVRNLQPPVHLPVYIEGHDTPFTMEAYLYREGSNESRYRLYQFITDLEAFARFARYIDPSQTVGYPVVTDNRIIYKISERPNNRVG